MSVELGSVVTESNFLPQTKKDQASYRVAKMHRMPCLYRSVYAKEWLLCGKSPAISDIPCIFDTLYEKRQKREGLRALCI